MILQGAPSRRLRVAAIGRTHWLYDAIEAVAARGHDIVLVGTAPAAPEYLRNEQDFLALAERLGCPGFVTTRLEQDDIVRAIAESGADVCISMNWPGMIRNATLGRFPLGVVNAHPGDLPRYRGNACPNWAILQGEFSVVLTLHCMTEVLDGGPVLMRRALPIDDTTYIADVYDMLTASIPEMYAELADALANGAVVAEEQSGYPWDGMRCHPRRPEDGLIDWSKSATEISRLVRASAEPFAGAFTWLDDTLVRVWRAAEIVPEGQTLGIPGQVVAIDAGSGSVTVLCGDGQLTLSLVSVGDGERLQPAGVVRSSRQRFGINAMRVMERMQARIAQLEAIVKPAASVA